MQQRPYVTWEQFYKALSLVGLKDRMTNYPRQLGILERLNRLQKTVVMVTHDRRAAHHVTVIRRLDKSMLLPEGVTT